MAAILCVCLIAFMLSSTNGQNGCGIDGAVDQPRHCFTAVKMDVLPAPEDAVTADQKPCVLPKVDSNEKLKDLMEAIGTIHPDVTNYKFWLGLNRSDPVTWDESRNPEKWAEASKWHWSDGTAMEQLDNVTIEFKNDKAKSRDGSMNESCVIFSQMASNTTWVDEPCVEYNPQRPSATLLLICEAQSPEGSSTEGSGEEQSSSAIAEESTEGQAKPSNGGGPNIHDLTTTTTKPDSSTASWVWITVGVCLGALLLFLIGACIFVRSRKQKERPHAVKKESKKKSNSKKPSGGSTATGIASAADDDSSVNELHSAREIEETRPYTYVRLKPKVEGDESVRKVYLNDAKSTVITESTGRKEMASMKPLASGKKAKAILATSVKATSATKAPGSKSACKIVRKKTAK